MRENNCVPAAKEFRVCWSVDTFSTVRGKTTTTKNYANVYRITINDGDSQTSLSSIFFCGREVCTQVTIMCDM